MSPGSAAAHASRQTLLIDLGFCDHVSIMISADALVLMLMLMLELCICHFANL